MTPRAGEGGQTEHGTRCIAAALGTLDAVIQANGSRLGVGIVVSQLANVGGLQATHLGGSLRRPLQSAFAQGVKTDRVLLDVVMVQPVVGDEFVHQRQGQGGIGAWFEGQMHIAFVGGFAATRIDAHQFGSLAFGLLGDAPKMHAAGDGVAAPNQDQFGFGKVLHLHAQLAAKGVGQSFSTRAGTNRAVQLGRTQQVEKPHGNRLALHHAHGARIAVGQDALRVLVGNGFQARRDVAQGLVPTDAFE